MVRKSSTPRTRTPLAIGLLVALLAAGVVIMVALSPSVDRVTPPPREPGWDETTLRPPASRFQPAGRLMVWWDRLPSDRPLAKSSVALAGKEGSNIHPGDYIGPHACWECHRENYESWSHHAHRWMNALAEPATVKGDFDSGATIRYLGGTAKFFREHDGSGSGYRMLLTRGDVRKLYHIHQTIGSRFFQYYVGKLVEGPEAADDPAYHTDHVLPFGYWLDRREWVPVVHVGVRAELPDGARDDPFAADPARNSFSPYHQCNSCHTTFPLADQMSRAFWVLGRHAPHTLHWSMFGYLADERTSLLRGRTSPAEFTEQELASTFIEMGQFEAPEHAATLGISCEACHLGSKEHAEGEIEKPSFFPYSPHLLVEAQTLETGRTHANINWACGRCHTGDRPLYAGGMSTWNSTEYTDAMKGSCYSELSCIDCHDPHRGIGPQWTRSAAEDDASCLSCHQQYQQSDALVAHTHHGPGSEGSRCMNCHMPRINEGLQNVVRTHTIFSPTNSQMIEANHPNACGLCHTDKTIDWTVAHLREWYGATYSQEQLARNYPHRNEPAAIGWLKSENEAVRLAATDAVARQKDTGALAALIDVLDDPYLLNRQFARIALEDWLGIRLEAFGYRFYMTTQERRRPLERIRQELLPRDESL